MNDLKHLYNQYYLGVDPLNFIVYERVVNTRGVREGSERFKAIWFFTTVKALKFSLINQYSIDKIHNIELESFFSELNRILETIKRECTK